MQVIFDQYSCIGPKILVPVQNLKNIVKKNIVHFRIRKNISQKNIDPFLKIGPILDLKNIG